MKTLDIYKPYSVESIYGCGDTVEIEYKIPAGNISFTYNGQEEGSVYEGTRYIGVLNRNNKGAIEFQPNEAGKEFYSDVKKAFHIEVEGGAVFFKDIKGDFTVLSNGEEVHYTRFLPAMNAVKMWGLSIPAALNECYGDEDLTLEATFPEGAKLANEYKRLWNEIKRNA